MSIPWDVDILTFAWSTIKILFHAKKQMRKSQRAIPVHEELEEVPETALTEAQKRYIEKFDQQLAKLNYFPVCTYRVTNYRNYGHNLSRRYANPADPAACNLTIVELKAKVGEVESVKTSSHVAFRTRFSDGKQLITRNMSLKSLMDKPPDRILQECRHTTDIADLKRRHDAKRVELGPMLPPPSGKEAIFKEQHEEHRHYSQYQLQRGIYALTPDGAAYEATDKAHMRGTWNHYNPFARRISISEMLLTGLVGAVLPLLAILRIAPLVASWMDGSALSGLSVTSLVIGLAYAVAGIIIGLASDRASFPWIMLISYVPAHLLAGWSFGWFPYSTLMFVAAFCVRQALRRRALIFET
jgi:hypothetical protein